VLPTLSPGDTLIDSGGNNVLNAFFNGGVLIGGLTIEGVQAWNFSNLSAGAAVIGLPGGPNLGGPGPIGGTTNMGVQKITLQNSTAATTVEVGGNGAGTAGAGTGIQSILSAVNMIDNLATDTVSVFESAALFSGSTITVTVLNATSGTAVVDVGPDVGTTGYTIWNLHSTGGNTIVNSIALGATTATNATTLNLFDDGASTVLNASTADLSLAHDWGHLTLISGTGNTTGTWTITGGTGVGTVAGTTGFLAGLSGVGGAFSVQLDNAAGNDVDLSAWGGTATNLTINLGTGAGDVLYLNSGLVDTTVGFGATGTGSFQVGTSATLNDVGTNVGGNINMSFFPGVTDITWRPQLVARV